MLVPEIEAIGIVKRYGGLVANEHVNLSAERGEIHGLMGENGAGKTTLMSILFGLQAPDAGEIRLRGAAVHFRSPLDAMAAGIGMVHQSFKLFSSLTVWENVVYGSEPMRGPLIDSRVARAEVAEMAERHRLTVDPDATVGALSVGVRQRVEILKALYRNARVLILDEPTAVLTPPERDALFGVLRRLAAQGRTVLFVTHKLHEATAITERVTILRDGRTVAVLRTAETSAREIIRAMTGRNVNLSVQKGSAHVGAPRLTAVDLSVAGGAARPAVDRVSLSVRAGEIVGIAGVAGNGQNELVEALVGLRRPDRGRVEICGLDVSHADVEAHRTAGLAYIPEDRAAVGSALSACAVDNLAMGFQRAAPLSRRGFIDRGAMAEWARALIRRYAIRIASERIAVGTLSGGNLQKVVVARELAHKAPVLIAEQPTRGLDVGATERIHERLVAERDSGRAVLLVSAELSEILALSDRVLVMFEGRILADLPQEEADEQSVGLLMAGRTKEAA
ncbi:MAG: ABC transporter ATP-binding protein [Hyphomicrobiales bacterium]|nr:ABC transporter ATP-binding protein [Hyphomicrobiales bacterium]